MWKRRIKNTWLNVREHLVAVTAVLGIGVLILLSIAVFPILLVIGIVTILVIAFKVIRMRQIKKRKSYIRKN